MARAANLDRFQTMDANGNLIVTKPANGVFVNTPGSRNTIHNPRFENWNVGLFKKFAIGNRLDSSSARRPSTCSITRIGTGPNYNPTNLSTFGKITGKTNDVRNLQLSLRFYFYTKRQRHRDSRPSSGDRLFVCAGVALMSL